jgi:hypothetical protein
MKLVEKGQKTGPFLDEVAEKLTWLNELTELPVDRPALAPVLFAFIAFPQTCMRAYRQFMQIRMHLLMDQSPKISSCPPPDIRIHLFRLIWIHKA